MKSRFWRCCDWSCGMSWCINQIKCLWKTWRVEIRVWFRFASLIRSGSSLYGPTDVSLLKVGWISFRRSIYFFYIDLKPTFYLVKFEFVIQNIRPFRELSPTTACQSISRILNIISPRQVYTLYCRIILHI